MNFWKVSQSSTSAAGEECITDALHRESLIKCFVTVHRDTPSKGQSSETQGYWFTNTVKKGDVFYLCRGNHQINRIGVFCDKLEIMEDGWARQYYRPLFDIVSGKNIGWPVYKEEEKWWTPNSNSTFIQVKEHDLKMFEKLISLPFFNATIDEIKHKAKLELNKYMEDAMKDEIGKLLIGNKQIVLTGAPGTGKTYMAHEIAAQMINCTESKETELEKSGRFAFVQFHPNYDYSDFVEGLKPDLVNDQIKFKLVPGIFKEFCERAQKAYDESPMEGSDPTKEKGNAPKYVFVIDEINRADLSRVFGELFFGLEADYRGKPIKMQYSYLYGENYGEKDKAFSIPPNIYIIGTMNDIDRSVESMDFALRRRFAWKEISAKESEHIIDKAEKISDDLKQQAKDRMGKLNDKIKEVMGSASYQIGGAYFRKLEKYKDDQAPFECLWENHLAILLQEYLRGIPKSKGQKDPLTEFKNAYKLQG